MNLDLTSSSSRTRRTQPRKNHTNPEYQTQRTQENQTRKIINEYCTKQNQSTFF